MIVNKKKETNQNRNRKREFDKYAAMIDEMIFDEITFVKYFTSYGTVYINAQKFLKIFTNVCEISEY